MTWKIALGVAACVACAQTIPPPNERLAQTALLFREAKTLNAADVPEARAALQRAKDEVDQAARLMRAGKNAEAKLCVARANVDAELALELGREAIIHERERQARAAVVAAREGK